MQHERKLWEGIDIQIIVQHEQTRSSKISGGFMWREITGVNQLENLFLIQFDYLCSHRFLTDHCWTVAKIYRGIELDEIVNREDNLPLHIDELRNAIFDVTNALVNSYSYSI